MDGFQTGADLAAADAARFLDIDNWGWTPRGRRNENGLIPNDYNCKETESYGYRDRTLFNVRDSDATLVFSIGPATGGTYYTIMCCEKLKKPYLFIDLKKLKSERKILAWLKEINPQVLNVAGSRASKHPEIYWLVRTLLIEVLIKHNKIKTE